MSLVHAYVQLFKLFWADVFSSKYFPEEEEKQGNQNDL